MFVFCVWFGRITAYEESVLLVSTRPVALEPLECPSPGIMVGCPPWAGFAPGGWRRPPQVPRPAGSQTAHQSGWRAALAAGLRGRYMH